MMATVDMSVMIFRRNPGVANVLEWTQSVAWIGPPFAVGQFSGHRNFHAITVGDLSYTNHFNYFADLCGQPAMAGRKFVALAIEVQMKFNQRRAPMLHRAHHYCW